jgi:putative ABC transport system substrate-binding protein
MLNKRNITVIDIPAIDVDDLHLQLLTVISEIDALYLACGAFTQGEGGKIVIDMAKSHHIPTFSCSQGNTARGSLISYSYPPASIGKLAGKKAALILQGAEPTWLHTESPSDGIVTINTNTASQLGIDIPFKLRQEARYVFKH